MTARLMATARKRAPASSYNPLTSISWLVGCWADDPGWAKPANGAAVPSWRSGGTIIVEPTQASSSMRPIYRSTVAGLNNRGGVQFDGVNDLLTANLTSRAQPLTAVWIGTYNGVGGGGSERTLDFAGDDGPFTSMFFQQSSGKFAMFAGSGGITSPVSFSLGGHAQRAYFNGASSALNVNGTNMTGSPGTGAATRFSIGGRTGASTAADYSDQTTAFAGLYAGNITSNAGWATFKSWVSTYYGLTIA